MSSNQLPQQGEPLPPDDMGRSNYSSSGIICPGCQRRVPSVHNRAGSKLMQCWSCWMKDRHA